MVSCSWIWVCLSDHYFHFIGCSGTSRSSNLECCCLGRWPWCCPCQSFPSFCVSSTFLEFSCQLVLVLVWFLFWHPKSPSQVYEWCFILPSFDWTLYVHSAGVQRYFHANQLLHLSHLWVISSVTQHSCSFWFLVVSSDFACFYSFQKHHTNFQKLTLPSAVKICSSCCDMRPDWALLPSYSSSFWSGSPPMIMPVPSISSDIGCSALSIDRCHPSFRFICSWWSFSWTSFSSKWSPRRCARWFHRMYRLGAGQLWKRLGRIFVTLGSRCLGLVGFVACSSATSGLS